MTKRLADVRDLLLRMMPHATTTGLRKVGDPDGDSPVLVTCNFALTVRRLMAALAGRDAWVLVANSDGINVWCAATGGHLSHHDVISAIRTTDLASHVRHRELVLPQLAATGVERRAIETATGFRARWGPARLEDLPAYLDRGHAERTMRFPLWERLEMSSVWSVPMATITGVVVGLLTSWGIGMATAAAVLASITLLFVILRHVAVQGPRRWLTYATVWLLQAGSVLGGLAAAGGWSTAAAAVVAVATLAEVLMLSIDVAGTTPWYASTINTFRNPHRIELDEAACTGAAQCVLVCPSDVLKMDGERRKVVVASPDACVLCGACIVQCPEDALYFRYPDGSIVPPETVRRTRLNMLGRRTIELRPPSAPEP